MHKSILNYYANFMNAVLAAWKGIHVVGADDLMNLFLLGRIVMQF